MKWTYIAAAVVAVSVSAVAIVQNPWRSMRDTDRTRLAGYVQKTYKLPHPYVWM